MSMGPENPTTAAPVDPFPIAADEIEASATKEECIWRIIRVKPQTLGVIQPGAGFARMRAKRRSNEISSTGEVSRKLREHTSSRTVAAFIAMLTPWGFSPVASGTYEPH
ncbi:MAG TPA: hypothetical protein VEJ67_00660 [Candidatus Cybelea sp.]|nr:hypothetical protein [Candidatus Cybelea sp.]